MHPHGNASKELHISDPRINERIRVPEVRLVGPAGEQVGIVRVEDALRLAREADLDLVEVAPGSRPPVAKIMDYGKFKYEQAQKAKEARRNQANTVLKEVRFRLKIDEHDYETKRKRAERFLQAGDKVKAMILFRGREQSRPEMGVRLLQRFAEDVAELGSVEHAPTIDGRNMTMIVGPVRSKSDAKAEQNAQRSAQRAADQEKRRKTAEEKAARQAAVEATKPPAPPRAAPTQPAAPSSSGSSQRSAPRSTPRSAPRQGTRSVGDATAAARAAKAPRTPKPAEGASSDARAAKPEAAPKQSEAKPSTPDASSSAPKPAAAAAKPAAPAAAKPAAKPARPAAKPASK